MDENKQVKAECFPPQKSKTEEFLRALVIGFATGVAATVSVIGLIAGGGEKK